MTHLTDEVGSVTCRCTRAMWMWLSSLALVWASRWMSGDVWLIFMADSGSTVGALGSFSKSSLYSRSRPSTSVRTGCCSPCWSFRPGKKRSRHGTQNNFHDTNRETANSARPHVVTKRDSRLTDTSGAITKREIRSLDGVQNCEDIYRSAVSSFFFYIIHKIPSCFQLKKTKC